MSTVKVTLVVEIDDLRPITRTANVTTDGNPFTMARHVRIAVGQSVDVAVEDLEEREARRPGPGAPPVYLPGWPDLSETREP